MKRISRRKELIIIATVTTALAVSGVGAYAAESDGSAPDASPIQEWAAAGAGPGVFARANGLNPADATPVFELRNGQSVSIVAGTTAKCLLRSADGHVSETCGTLAAIDEGRAISVLDECGTGGGNRMEITGLAPDGIEIVRLNISDGTSEAANVVNGAFRFEGTNPTQGSPYPTGVEWLTGAGTGAGGAPLPVSGDQFCLPTS